MPSPKEYSSRHANDSVHSSNSLHDKHSATKFKKNFSYFETPSTAICQVSVHDGSWFFKISHFFHSDLACCCLISKFEFFLSGEQTKHEGEQVFCTAPSLVNTPCERSEKKIENLAKRKLRTHQNGNTGIKVSKWKSFAPYTSFTAKISDCWGFVRQKWIFIRFPSFKFNCLDTAWLALPLVFTEIMANERQKLISRAGLSEAEANLMCQLFHVK